jgi:teichuronic acid biosynthesis glycosyltransferase TuaG
MNILNKVTTKEPKVSIIIPYYKKRAFLKKTLQSVMSQSYQNYEIIIIYDDHDLNDLNFIKEILRRKKKVKIIVNKKNLGVAKSRNIGIKHSSGDYIAFIDSDDVWMKNKLKEHVFFMHNKNLDFSFSSYLITDSNLKILGLVDAPKIINYNDLKYFCNIGLSTVIIKKKFLGKNYFPDISTKEDYALWLILSNKKNFIGYNKYLTKWRKTKGSLSSNFFLKFKNLYFINKNYLKNNFIVSIFFILIYVFLYVRKTVLSRIKYLVKY